MQLPLAWLANVSCNQARQGVSAAGVVVKALGPGSSSRRLIWVLVACAPPHHSRLLQLAETSLLLSSSCAGRWCPLRACGGASRASCWHRIIMAAAAARLVQPVCPCITLHCCCSPHFGVRVFSRWQSAAETPAVRCWCVVLHGRALVLTICHNCAGCTKHASRVFKTCYVIPRQAKHTPLQRARFCESCPCSTLWRGVVCDELASYVAWHQPMGMRSDICWH